MEETSGRATEEGYLSQDGQKCNRGYLIEDIFEVCGSRRTTEQAEASTRGAWVIWGPLHRGDLDEDRPHKVIS